MLPYLKDEKAGGYDINLSVEIQTEKGGPFTVSNSNLKNLVIFAVRIQNLFAVDLRFTPFFILSTVLEYETAVGPPLRNRLQHAAWGSSWFWDYQWTCAFNDIFFRKRVCDLPSVNMHENFLNCRLRIAMAACWRFAGKVPSQRSFPMAKCENSWLTTILSS